MHQLLNQVAGQAMWRDLNTNFQGGIVYVKTNGKLNCSLMMAQQQLVIIELRHNEIGSSNEVVLSGTYFI